MFMYFIVCLYIFIGMYVLYSVSLCCFVYCLYVYVYLQLPPINLLMPNVNYSGRTTLLTSKVAFYIFIQQI